MDAIISVHTNPLTSGVCKFNVQLADRLHVKLLRYGSPEAHAAKHPLISVKCSEVAEANALAPHPVYSLFLHDWGGSFRDVHAVKGAVQVFAANGVIARQVREVRPDVIEAFCPSTVQGNPTRGAIDVLTFGMAHKMTAPHFRRLRTMLDAIGDDYTVSVTTGIHEGSPWEASFTQNQDLLWGLFGSKLRHLGFLADDALVLEMRRATCVALFFDPALRANNTTAWAVLDAGRPLLTNLDADSPAGVRALDRSQDWPALPDGWALLDAVRADDQAHPFTWSALLDRLAVPVSA